MELQNEIEFFDKWAANRTGVAVDSRTVQRYAVPTGPWAIDFMFRLAGDVRGRNVLDVGCGCGENALVLAALGAHVTALDISPESLRVLWESAILSGLAPRIKTICCPIEDYRPSRQYDLVWADAFLHHVIPSLGKVVEGLQRASRGRVIMSEPTSPAWLRRLRLTLPISAEGTDGERPLTPADLALIAERLPGIKYQYFRCLSRAVRWAPERVVRPLAVVDNVLLKVPALRPFASTVVMWT